MLRLYWDVDGYSAGICAQLLGVTRNAVIGRVHRMRLTRRNSPIKTILRVRADKPRKRRLRLMAHEPVIDPIAAAPAPVLRTGPVRLIDLQPQHCRWPIGKPPEMLFCGEVKEDCSSYCPAHARRAFTPSSRPR